MKVAVIGAGIVGVTTAYELAAEGHEVVVLERRSSVASESSFANSGLVAPGYAGPWTAPGMAWKLRGLHAGAFGQLPWLWRFWRSLRPAVHKTNRAAMLRLALASQARLRELAKKLELDYDQRDGLLVLLRTEADLKRTKKSMSALADMGAAFQIVDAARAREIEPALAPATPLHAAIHLPGAEVGNCRQFAQQLMAQARSLGTEFRFETEVLRVIPGVQPAVHTAAGEERFGAVVLASGVESNALLRTFGIRLPILPVWGYSVSAPLREYAGAEAHVPQAAVIDEAFKVAISRLGERVRVAGGAEIGSRPDVIDDAKLATLYKVLDDWFPGAAVTPKALHWKGARPMLPDGPPVLGASGAPGVWLNLGHGASGWALACGSARVLAELVGGRRPSLDLTSLGIERLV